MSNAATHIKEQARRIAELEIQASSWKRLSQEWKARHDILAARLAAVPVPEKAYVNKDGHCDRWAPGAYEVPALAPAPAPEPTP